jgi:hypothetical protein
MFWNFKLEFAKINMFFFLRIIIHFQTIFGLKLFNVCNRYYKFSCVGVKKNSNNNQFPASDFHAYKYM